MSKAQPTPLIAGTLTVDDVADAALEADRARWLPTSELSDAEREAYLTCEVEGVAPSELARFVDRSASTIRTQLSRARRKVREAER